MTGCNVGQWFAEHPQAVSEAEQVAKDAAVAAANAAEADLKNDATGSSQLPSKTQ